MCAFIAALSILRGCVFRQVPYRFDYLALQYIFEVRKCDASSFVLLRTVLALQGPLRLHTNLHCYAIIGLVNYVSLN